jgi:hypothetical protein
VLPRDFGVCGRSAGSWPCSSSCRELYDPGCRRGSVGEVDELGYFVSGEMRKKEQKIGER